MKTFRTLFLLIALLVVPFSSFADEPEKPVVLSGWKIGLSNSLYMTAPSNLGVGGVEWSKNGIAFMPMSWSGQNADVRVEVARGSSSQWEKLRDAAFQSIGGGVGIKSLVDTYEGAQLEKNGKFAGAWKQGATAWAVVVAPGNTPTAKDVMKTVRTSIWLERIEAPEWKDRTVGMSFQAELPYDLSLFDRQGEDGTEYYRARWGDFSIETLKGGWRTDFDKTFDNGANSFAKRTDVKNVKVQTSSREFGYLAKERGRVAQVDFLRGDVPHRIYRIGSVTGYGGVITTITIKPQDLRQLHAAHRVLSTLRLGYGVGGETYQKVDLPIESLSFQNPTGFRTPSDDGVIRTHIGNDQRHFLFSIDAKPTILPLVGEMKQVGEMTRGTMLGRFLEGAGGKMTNATISSMAVGAFPSQRVRFEAQFKNERFYGDAMNVMTTSRMLVPLYLTTTATNDVMPHTASTWQFNFPSPKGWKLQKAGTGDFQLLLPEDIKPTLEDGKWTLELNRDGVQVKIEELRQPLRDEIYISLDGMTDGEKADNPIETHYGSLLRLRNRMEKNYGFHWARTSVGEAFGVAGWGSATDLSRQQDGIVLQSPTHSWLLEVIWNPKDKKSCDTRDAILGSIRCDSAFTAEPSAPVVPNTPVAPTIPVAPGGDIGDYDWGWWF